MLSGYMGCGDAQIDVPELKLRKVKLMAWIPAKSSVLAGIGEVSLQ